jgi:hypothetical protein|tara:strand:- start:543 stop:995 length:453 start_codon:yes stop_codon:yes gene_type:complete
MSVIWDKYRKESKQTILVLGVIILSVKLCKADGIFTKIEREEILDIIPHLPEEKETILGIIQEAEADKESAVEDAHKIKELLGESNKAFFEFIIAALVRLAKVDKMVYQEKKFIEQVAEEFGLNKNPVIEFFKTATQYISNKRLGVSNNA